MTIKSNTPAHDKDCWQTPLWLFDALDIEFGFWLDSAASDKNALCAHWLTEADDALNSEWVSHGAIWNNPPYSNIRPWVEKAAEQCIQQRQTVVMLVPEDMSVGWFSKALESVDEVRIITDGRINFIEPSTGGGEEGKQQRLHAADLATVHQSSTDVYYRIQSGIDGDRAGRQEGGMRRQRRSITDIICENCKYLPTKRSRNKPKPIPKESDVKTFNYTAHLWDIRWLRHRARNTR
ncbi:putative DNA N-6-adenine-methyltransferase from phage origin [Escherichia coli O55:H7 str. USDA 5905]|nr:putative DNA N-6-adenine-methyltransferase from phage origin [Escherichia coli O55:H7 str. USDA 5905]